MGGRASAKYDFSGMTNEMHKENTCAECDELYDLFKELCEVDSKYRQEWMKLTAKARGSHSGALRHAQYRRKRGNRF